MSSQEIFPVDRPYEEIGSIEGYCARIERDDYGRRLLLVRHRISGDMVKCVINEDALGEISDHRMEMVFADQRILVSGRIKYKARGKISEVVANRIRALRSSSELLNLDDIYDPNFTGGLSTEEYLKRLRDGL